MNVLVTGANRGIGLEFVRQLLEAGHLVTATARSPERASELNAMAKERPEALTVLPLDVTSPESVCKLAGALSDSSIDILINNAGVLLNAGPLGKFDYGPMAKCYEVNVLGTLRVVEATLPHVKRGGRKTIVNISSKMGSIADNGSGGSYAYRMSKTALNMATKCLANELAGDGVTVVTMHPGWVQTDMGGANALIDTETSVSGLLSVIMKLTPEANGSFLEWNGNTIPW